MSAKTGSEKLLSHVHGMKEPTKVLLPFTVCGEQFGLAV